MVKKIKEKILTFTVMYKEAPEGGYVAFVSSLPGCHTQGETLEEVRKNVREAIELYLESLRAQGESLPEKTETIQEFVKVLVPA